MHRTLAALVLSLTLALGVSQAALTFSYAGGDAFGGGAAQALRDATFNPANPAVTRVDLVAPAPRIPELIDIFPGTDGPFDLRFSAYQAGNGYVEDTTYHNYGNYISKLNAGAGFVLKHYNYGNAFNDPTGLDFTLAPISEAGMAQALQGDAPTSTYGSPDGDALVGSYDNQRGGTPGMSPISGTNGSYTLITNAIKVGVSVGAHIYPSENNIKTFTLYVFDTAGSYLGYGSFTTDPADGNRAYMTVTSDVMIGAVVVNSSVANITGYRAFDFQAKIPEPATLAVFGLGAGLTLLRRRGRK